MREENLLILDIDGTKTTFRYPSYDIFTKFDVNLSQDLDPDGGYKAEKYLIEACFVSGDKRFLDIDNNADLFIRCITESEIYSLIQEYPSDILLNDDGTYTITIKTPEKEYSAVFQNIKNFQHFCQYMKFADKWRIKGQKLLMDSCFISGDPEIKDVNKFPKLFWSMRKHIHHLVGLYKEDLKKK